MALSESGGAYAAVQIYGPRGKRKTVKPKRVVRAPNHAPRFAPRRPSKRKK